MNRLQRMRSRPYGASLIPGPAVWAGVVAVLAVASIAGWGLANAVTAEPAAVPVSPPMTVAIGDTRVTLRSGWSRIARGPAVAGLDRTGASVFGPPDGSGGRLILTPIGGQETELPAATVAALRAPPGAPRRATVGGVIGASYLGLSPRGVNGLLDVYALSTATGSIAVSCVAPITDPLPVGACPGDVVAVSATPRRADRAAALLARLPGVLRTLDRRRVEARRALARARTPGGQARQASRLARAYAQAAAAAKPLAPASGPGAPVPGVLSDAAAAYRRLAAAAERRDPGGWSDSRGAVGAAERAVSAQLAGVRAT